MALEMTRSALALDDSRAHAPARAKIAIEADSPRCPRDGRLSSRCKIIISPMKVLFATLVSCVLAFAQTMTIEEYDPKSTLVVPEHPVTRAKYPFIDVHNHQAKCTSKECVDKLISDMDKLNLRVMVNLSGGYGDNLKRLLAAQTDRYPDRLIVFANIDFNGLDDPGYPARAAAQLEQDVKNGAQGLKIFKNFGMDVERRQGPAHSRRRPALRSGLRGLRPVEDSRPDSHRRARACSFSRRTNTTSAGSS